MADDHIFAKIVGSDTSSTADEPNPDNNEEEPKQNTNLQVWSTEKRTSPPPFSTSPPWREQHLGHNLTPKDHLYSRTTTEGEGASDLDALLNPPPLEAPALALRNKRPDKLPVP